MGWHLTVVYIHVSQDDEVNKYLFQKHVIVGIGVHNDYTKVSYLFFFGAKHRLA